MGPSGAPRSRSFWEAEWRLEPEGEGRVHQSERGEGRVEDEVGPRRGGVFCGGEQQQRPWGRLSGHVADLFPALLPDVQAARGERRWGWHGTLVPG